MTSTDLTARDITRLLRTYLPHVTISTSAGTHAGEFDVRLPGAAFDNMGGAHGLVAALGSRTGVQFGTDGVTWARRGDRVATVHLYTRSTRDASTKTAEQEARAAEETRRAALIAPKTLADAVAALDSQPFGGPGTGLTESISANYLAGLRCVLEAARSELAGQHDPVARALARVDTAQGRPYAFGAALGRELYALRQLAYAVAASKPAPGSEQASALEGTAGPFSCPEHERAALRDLADAVRQASPEPARVPDSRELDTWPASEYPDVITVNGVTYHRAPF
jgi:hypothetical protein